MRILAALFIWFCAGTAALAQGHDQEVSSKYEGGTREEQRCIQFMLKYLGYDPQGADGKIGQNTRLALLGQLRDAAWIRDKLSRLDVLAQKLENAASSLEEAAKRGERPVEPTCCCTSQIQSDPIIVDIIKELRDIREKLENDDKIDIYLKNGLWPTVGLLAAVMLFYLLLKGKIGKISVSKEGVIIEAGFIGGDLPSQGVFRTK